MHSDCASDSHHQENKCCKYQNQQRIMGAELHTAVHNRDVAAAAAASETLQSGAADMNNSQQTAMTPNFKFTG